MERCQGRESPDKGMNWQNAARTLTAGSWPLWRRALEYDAAGYGPLAWQAVPANLVSAVNPHRQAESRDGRLMPRLFGPRHAYVRIGAR